MFILDKSTFVSGEAQFVAAKNFIRSIVIELDIGYNKTRVGVITVGTESSLEIAPNEYNEKRFLATGIDAIGNPFQPTPAVDMSEALRLARLEGFTELRGSRVRIPDILIFVVSHTLPYATSPVIAEIERLRDRNTAVIGVVFGTTDRNYHMDQLRQVVSPPASSNSFVTANANSLTSLQDNLVTRLCEEVPGKSASDRELTCR